MDFKNAKELLELCQKQNLPISEIMLRREMTEGEMPEEEARSRMARALAIMKESAHTPIQTPVRSMGGLIGGEAEKLTSHQAAGRGICGDVLEKAITYAVAVLETNASMGLIVAAPTAVPPVWSRVCYWHCRNVTFFLIMTSSKPCSMPALSVTWL